MPLDPIITEARLGWDRHDPWGSGMALLGAVCDFYTAVGFGRDGHSWTDGTPPIPAELGYRPSAALVTGEFSALAHQDGTVIDEVGTPGLEWDDPAMWDVASALGFSLTTDEIGVPDVIASDADWAAAPELLQRTMRILHRYLGIVEAAGRSY